MAENFMVWSAEVVVERLGGVRLNNLGCLPAFLYLSRRGSGRLRSPFPLLLPSVSHHFLTECPGSQAKPCIPSPGCQVCTIGQCYVPNAPPQTQPILSPDTPLMKFELPSKAERQGRLDSARKTSENEAKSRKFWGRQFVIEHRLLKGV